MFLMWIKGFLGFTDGIKEPQKTKIEHELKKFCRYNGMVYNAVTFLCMKLLEGCRPEKEENEQHCKRNGELSKPKILYRYTDPDQEAYFELNKTQYNFVCYLIENGLDTEKAMLAYDNAEEARRQTELEEKARQEAEERKQAEERERIHRMIEEEAQCIPPEEKEIVDRIFVDLYGEEQPWNYSLVALIHNLDDPYCKEEIILRLHNQNKASTKIFECITGLKLPTSYHERKHYIEGLTVADFKGMIQYKPQKKRKEKEVQKEEFYVSERTPEGQKWTKVIGEPFTKYGVDMFISYGDGKVSIFCAEAGMKVCDGKTKTECMEKLKKVVDDRGKELFLRTIKDVTKHIYETIGTNPRYRRKNEDV